MERYLTANDAAREMGVTETTVVNMVKRGELPQAAETRSGIRLYRPEDVRRVAAERATRPTRRGSLVSPVGAAGTV